MKNRVVEIDDNIVAIEIIYKGTRLLCYISKKEQNAQNISSTLSSLTHCRNVTIEEGKYRVRINGKSFGRYNTLEEARQVAERERRNIFPVSSGLNNKIIL